jgi:hypothetical protein
VRVGRSPRYLRLDQTTGAVLQTLDLASMPGLARDTPQGSARNIVMNGADPVMFQTVSSPGRRRARIWLAAIDLASPTGSLLWKVPLGAVRNPGMQPQFPIALTRGGPVMVALRPDGTVFGISLH